MRDDRQPEEWPERKVVSYSEVKNKFDGELFAVRKDLECGHHVIATGSFIFDRGTVRCKKCYLSSQKQSRG